MITAELGSEVFKYDKIVIGSSMSAVLYAFVKNYPIFFAEEHRPFRFDYFDPHIDLSCLKIPGAAKSLTTFEGEKKVGVPKEILWERLLFLMAVTGQSPLSNLCGTVRYDGDTVVCSNEYSKIMEFTFKECFYFTDKNATGFVEQKSLDDDTYICYDYIGFNKGGKHEIDYIKTSDDFVREIWFYPSDRIDGNTPVKDACAVSVVKAEQLPHFEFSQTMSRFKVIDEMEKRGMKGTFAHDYTTAGNPKHYKFRTTSINRETNKQPNELTPEADNIKIAKDSEESMLKDLPSACMAYDRFLRYW
jgi:hypothetical protein